MSCRMRTISEAAKYFKEKDKGTSLTEFAIRTLVLSGKVPYVQIGRKYLLSLDRLEEYLLNNDPEEAPHRGIRPVRNRMGG